MSSERKNTGLRVALASYDVHQLRVWHQYIAEQSAEILCSEYRSGEELLQSLKQGRAGVWNAGAALWPDVSGVGDHPAGQQL